MRRVREGEVPPDGATALQDDPDRPVFRANGPYDYVCVECGNVLAASMGLEQMTKRVRIKCGALQDGQRRGVRRQGRDVVAFGSRPPQGGRAVHPRPGPLRRRRASCPGCCTAPSCARRSRTRRSSRSTSRAALQHPKVHAVLTAADLGDMAWMPTLSADVQAVLAGGQRALPGPGGGVRRRRRPLLGARRAGADRGRVRAAAGRRRRPRARWTPTRTPVRDERQPRLRLGGRRRARRPTPAFARAEVVVAQDMVFPRSHPAPMETCGAVAAFDRVDGKLTLWCTTQAPHAHRTLYSLITGLPEHRIRVISPDVGGGFGNKVPVYPGYVCAMAASMQLGRPVKWVEDRSENLMSTGFARDYAMRGRIAATRDGRILALDVDVIADHGAFNAAAQPTRYPAGLLLRLHRLLRRRGRALPRDRRVHQQGAGRRGVRVLVPDRRGRLSRRAARGLPRARAGHRSGGAAAAEPDPARAVPVRVARPAGSTTPATTRRRWTRRSRSPATTRCGREQAAKRGARRADGHRRLVLHRGRRRRPAQAHGHARAGHERRRGDPHVARPAPRRSRSASRPRARGTRRRSRRSSPHELGLVRRRRRRHPRRHGQHALRARHVRVALDAGERRRDRDRRAQGPRPRAARRRRDARGRARGPGVARRPLVGRRRPVAWARRSRRSRAAARGTIELPAGRRGRPRRRGRLRPAEPDVPVRRLRLRRRHRPRDRAS